MEKSIEVLELFAEAQHRVDQLAFFYHVMARRAEDSRERKRRFYAKWRQDPVWRKGVLEAQRKAYAKRKGSTVRAYSRRK